MRLDIPPYSAHLTTWGRAGEEWWALVVWNEHVGYDNPRVRYTGTQACAGWVSADHVTPAAEHVDGSAVPRISLPADSAGWPRPISRPGAYVPDDIWWVGVLDGGEPGLPPGARLLYPRPG